MQKMISWVMVIASIALITICVLLAGCSKKVKQNTTEYVAQVKWIHDGDTVTVIDAEKQEHKLRLYAIDAPELAQRGGRESMKNLIALLPKNGWINVEVENKDRYGREVATIYRKDENINRRQIADGQAWNYIKYNEKYMDDYTLTENLARKQKKGLWKDANPQPPWEYRKTKREKQH